MNAGQLIAIGGLAFLAYLYANKEAFTLEPQGADTTEPAQTNQQQSPQDQAEPQIYGGHNDDLNIMPHSGFFDSGFDPIQAAWDFANWVREIPVGYEEPQGMPVGGWIVDARTAGLDNIYVEPDWGLDLSPTYGFESGGGGSGSTTEDAAARADFSNYLPDWFQSL